MINMFVGCGDGRLRVREGGVWGEHCVNERKREKKGGKEKSKADGRLHCCFAGRYSVKIVYFT
jgi:hypothetical protein